MTMSIGPAMAKWIRAVHRGLSSSGTRWQMATAEGEPRQKGAWSKAVVVALAILLVGGLLYYAALYAPGQGTTPQSAQTTGSPTQITSSSSASSSSFLSTASTSATSPASLPFQIADPLFVNGKANISTPSYYSVLVDFALDLVNTDRSLNGLGNVTLSPIPSGQQHSDSMAYFGYLSHWDPQGYKPYMRYTMLGGSGGVAENAALDYCTDSSANTTEVIPTDCNLQTIENGLANSEWAMMNNDTQCCNNGHRDNILNPLHNRISIGIAYNVTTKAVYFDEDFEDAYTSFKTPLYSGGLVTLSGTSSKTIDVSEVAIYYDPAPQPVNTSQLSAPPFSDGYGAGTILGAVFAPCSKGFICPPNTSDGRIAVYASVWKLNPGGFEIQFDPTRFFANGAGIYTLYMFDTSENVYTSLSIVTG
jgi:uncharacterized protein YkwD